MKNHRVRTIIILVLAVVWPGNLIHAKTTTPVDLTQLADWDIVVADDAIPSEDYAAEEFQTFFAQASGLKLPIVSDINRPDRHIFIGPSQTMQASTLGFSVAQFAPEDLRIVARDNNIILAGGRPRGTLYAVYTFLEDYLGVRFLTPEHTHVPPIGDWRVVGPIDRIYRPPFQNYRYTGYQISWEHPVFGVRTRTNAITDDPKLGGKTPYVLINHSFYRQLMAKDYAQEHPDYFCLFDGKRLTDPGGHLQGNNPCYANPDVLDIITRDVLKEIEGPTGLAKGRLDYAVSQNDTAWAYCQCEQCAAIDKREGSSMGALLEFVNKVADRVAEVHPDVYVGTLSYFYSRKPPATIKPRPNVKIWLCSIECCQIHALNDPTCPRNVAFMNDLKGWRPITDHLSFWNYNVNFHDHLLPYPNLRAIPANIRLFAEAQAEGVFMQCAAAAGTEMSDLRHYLISSLLWDPTRDGEKLIDEFLTLHYSNAAPPYSSIHQPNPQSLSGNRRTQCLMHQRPLGSTRRSRYRPNRIGPLRSSGQLGRQRHHQESRRKGLHLCLPRRHRRHLATRQGRHN